MLPGLYKGMCPRCSGVIVGSLIDLRPTVPLLDPLLECIGIWVPKAFELLLRLDDGTAEEINPLLPLDGGTTEDSPLPDVCPPPYELGTIEDNPLPDIRPPPCELGTIEDNSLPDNCPPPYESETVEYNPLLDTCLPPYELGTTEDTPRALRTLLLIVLSPSGCAEPLCHMLPKFRQSGNGSGA
ncbi:hypothetical protein EJ05DRAFT_502998 [Pseudovirgaria hyperparasitica]|uniref:Uncharacterized protein n=1 Tax=Pseudovirgaria hyperparasitica TaxID=470096 RepID=A0A6A6VZ25_9PEZI|nr:uncharacterized protein EJ05DRAFT_502998 [Pseudovirgaria hyperparasitica]KAF2755543.1 hypothetical protein EJ05DRAFT_502998 [Pseudovirgaria hyperparasitica]